MQLLGTVLLGIKQAYCYGYNFPSVVDPLVTQHPELLLSVLFLLDAVLFYLVFYSSRPLVLDLFLLFHYLSVPSLFVIFVRYLIC